MKTNPYSFEGIERVPEHIVVYIRENEDELEKNFWLHTLIRTFEKLTIFMAQISLAEYKNSPLCGKSAMTDENSKSLVFEKKLNELPGDNKLAFGHYVMILRHLVNLFKKNRQHSEKFVSAVWFANKSKPDPWANFNILHGAVKESLVSAESISVRELYERKKASGPITSKQRLDMIQFIELILALRNRIAHPDDDGRFWPITEEYLDLSLDLLKQSLEALINELSPLWNNRVGQVTGINTRSMMVRTTNGSEFEIKKPSAKLSLSESDEVLIDPRTKIITADLSSQKYLVVHPKAEEILEKKALETQMIKDLKAFEKEIVAKLVDDDRIDLAERRELESVANYNLRIDNAEVEKIILEVAQNKGIKNPFAKFDPAFDEILDEAIKSGDVDILELSLQAKFHGLAFPDFQALFEQRARSLGKDPKELSKLKKLNIQADELADARCLTEVCCWLRDLRRLNAEKGGLYDSDSEMDSSYETRTAKHKRIFAEVRDMMAGRIKRLGAKDNWQTKINQWWSGKMVGYLWCQSYNAKKTVGYKKKLDGGELHLILWAKHHHNNTSIDLSAQSDWGFLRLGVGYTNDLMPGGKKYNPKKFDYPLYERIVSERTKETIREYYDAFRSHPDLFLFNHSLNSVSPRDELIPVSELEPSSGKLDDYFRHNPGLKTLRFINQWPLLKKNPVQVLRNLDSSFGLLSEMLVDIERAYELSIRTTGGKPSSCFYGLIPTLRNKLDDTKTKLPKELAVKLKEDRPKSGMGSRFVDSVSINKKTGERGLVELTYGFWQGEKENEIFCGFDARTALRSRPLSEEELTPEDDILYQFSQSFNESKHSIRDWRTQRYLDNLDYFYEPDHLSFRITLSRPEKNEFDKIDFEESWEETVDKIVELLDFQDGAFAKLFKKRNAQNQTWYSRPKIIK
jgi:hypothetical protein